MSLIKPLVFSLACLFLLAGCDRFEHVSIFGDEIQAINAKPGVEARTYIANKTIRTFAAYHGNQIEYMSEDGHAFLWYPGNRRAVTSIWALRPYHRLGGDNRYAICFNYEASSYNPATKEYGGQWECQDLGIYSSRVVEIADTDIFKLSTGRVPFRLERSNLTFRELKPVADKMNNK